MNKKSVDTHNKSRLPSVIIEYAGPSLEPGVTDIVFYFRPETNGVKYESTLLSVIYQRPLFKENIKVVYLANLPGDFIVQNKIIEEHYAAKLRFAHQGKALFTPAMRDRFEKYFGVSFQEAAIIGAFEAIETLGIDHETLFDLWVTSMDFDIIHGQTIKKYKDYFIVNYDIPALLHKNNERTDIAVMIFRSKLTSADFKKMLLEIKARLVEKGIADAGEPLNKKFHYSRGPFDQILDEIGYVYTPEIRHIQCEEISFFGYLLNAGFERGAVMTAIKNPIMFFKNKRGLTEEWNLFDYTADDSYADAARKLANAVLTRFN